MRIGVTSVFVEDQDEALGFYTEVLRFRKKEDVPVGEFRWLTAVSPEEPEGVELLLELHRHPFAVQRGEIRERGLKFGDRWNIAE